MSSPQAALQAAVDEKKVAAVKAALAAGADPDLRGDDGYVPLGSAIALKSKTVALALLAGGADPNGVGRTDGNPLLLDAVTALPDIIDAMVARGVDLNVVGGPKRWSALHAAVLRPKLDVAARLLHHGADINVKDGWNGRTPLAHVILVGSATALNAMQWLLDQGADPNVLDDAGRNALSLALPGGTDPCAALMARGARLLPHALHDAAGVTHPNADAIRFVIDHGADINGRDERGETALHLAALSHGAANVKALLALGADATVKNNEGLTAAEVAASFGDTAIAALLTKAMKSRSTRDDG
jgi:ankyrin repeat protein